MDIKAACTGLAAESIVVSVCCLVKTEPNVFYEDTVKKHWGCLHVH